MRKHLSKENLNEKGLEQPSEESSINLTMADVEPEIISKQDNSNRNLDYIDDIMRKHLCEADLIDKGLQHE